MLLFLVCWFFYGNRILTALFIITIIIIIIITVLVNKHFYP